MGTITISDLLHLSVAERLQLVEDLWDSIAAEPEALELTQAQKEELDRRMAEHRADPGSAIPWEEVRTRLRQRFS
ncbi:MAG: addiction module protein [Thermoanaerobaculia bacterium]|jgi:putative addiction module component (TIGR02574 family)